MENHNKKSTATFVLVSVFMILYTFSRQTFIPLIDTINVAGSRGWSLEIIASWFATAYAILQLPYGNMVDKLGLKKTIILLSTMMTVGFGLCTFSQSLAIFGIGRIITAIGCAGAFITTVKATEMQFGIDNIAKVMGILVSGALGLGALFIKYGSNFIRLSNNGWRYLYGVKFVLAFMVLIGMKLFGKDDTKYVKLDHSNGKPKAQIKEENPVSFWQCLNPYVLSLMLFSLVFFMIFYGTTETTLISRIYESIGIAKENVHSLLLLGFLAGFLTLPTLAKKIGEIKTCIISSLVLVIYSLQMFFYPNPLLAYGFAFLVGYSNGLQMTVVELAASKVPSSATGRLSAVMNVLFVGGVVIAQRILNFLVSFSSYGDQVLLLFITACGGISILLSILIGILRKNSK